MRLYVNNASYAELREIGSAWDRHCAWWRAFRSAFGDRRFWLFVAVELAILAAWPASMLGLISLADSAILRFLGVGGPALALSLILVAAVLVATTWGGDIIRPHLRKTTRIARESCPWCGHQLTSHLEAPSPDVRCPECGMTTPRSAFEPPYAIPNDCLALRRRRVAS